MYFKIAAGETIQIVVIMINVTSYPVNRVELFNKTQERNADRLLDERYIDGLDGDKD